MRLLDIASGGGTLVAASCLRGALPPVDLHPTGGGGWGGGRVMEINLPCAGTLPSKRGGLTVNGA